MKQILDINNWNRKDHFKFFNQFEEPFFGGTVQIDCTATYAWQRKKVIHFFCFTCINR